MDRGTARALLTAVLLFYGASVASTQQAVSDAGAPHFSLEQCIAQALETGSEAAAAARALEQARLTYTQTRAQNGLSLGATGSASHGDRYNLSPGADPDDSALGDNSARLGLALGLPGTDVTLSAGHTLSEARPTPQDPSEDPDNSTTVNLQVKQTLWDGVVGGRSRLNVEKATNTLEGQTLADQTARQDITWRVTQSYQALLSAQRNLEIRAADRAQKAAELERTRLLLDAGRASELDRRQAEINTRSAEIEERAAANGLRTARTSLSALLGWDRETVYAVQEIPMAAVPAADLEAAVAAALSNRLDLRKLELDRANGEIDLALTRAQGAPQISLAGSAGLSHDWTGDTTSGTWSVELSLSLPIADSGLARSRVRSGEMQNTGADAQIAELVKDIRTEVVDRLAGLADAQDRYELAGLSREQAELRYELARTQVELGTGSPLDVLNASAGLTTARVGLLKAQTDLQLAILEYNRAIGA